MNINCVLHCAVYKFRMPFEKKNHNNNCFNDKYLYPETIEMHSNVHIYMDFCIRINDWDRESGGYLTCVPLPMRCG